PNPPSPPDPKPSTVPVADGWALTDLFIHRPVLAAVVSLVLLLLGMIAFGRLPVRETPELQPPTVTVTTSWPGADPAIVETDVTEILEREINGIEGVRTLTSTSREQSSQIVVEFELERQLEEAANDVRARVARARRKLPDDVEEPVVEKADADAQAVIYLRVAAPDKNLLELTEIADTLIRERLQTVTGVSNVDIYGEQKFAMRIELDPTAIASRGIDLAQIQQALDAGNVDAPGGRVEGQATELSVRVDAGLTTPEEFEQLVVAEEGGAIVRLGDIANVRLGAENERTAARSDGIPSITVAVLPQARANIIDIADEVQARLDGIREDLPENTTINVSYDRTQAVRSSIEEVEETLVIAFGLVVVVIFAFLRDWRSTLVPALAIPVSIVGTFLFLWAAGFSINVFTLFGLVLAIGLVVDDAIVVLENVYRRIEEGEAPMTAAILGTRQIVFAVLATTVSLVVVFLPIVFTGGATGRLFLEFGATVAVSVALSGLVALTLTPMLSSRLLRPIETRGRVYQATERMFEALNHGFAVSLGRIAKVPAVAYGLVALALVGGLVGYNWLPREFFPIEDRNSFMIRVLAPDGTSFPYMNARMSELEPELMAAVPERTALLSRVASGQGGVAAAANTGMYFVALKPKEERARSQQEIVADVRKRLGGVTAFQTVPIQSPTVGRGFNAPLQFVLLNPDFEALSAALPGFVAEVRKIPGLSSVNEDLKLNRPELSVAVDREKAAAAGVSPRDVARTLQVLTANLELSQFKRGSRSYPVLVGLAPDARATPSDLERIEVRTRTGATVPLGNLVRLTEHSASSSRYHFDRSPSATISANVDGITLGEGIERIEALAAEKLPPGFRTALTGEAREFADSNQALLMMFGLAVALVYLALAAQFDSFIDPICILVSVPLALSGAFVGLALFGLTLSFFAQVGLILLVGLVTKNGILIVEYAKQQQVERGLSRWDSAIEAARIRFRPVLMTSVATIVGALPVALGFSSESRAPLGVSVVSGMAVATALTLYVTPVIYATVATTVDRLRGTRAAAATAATGAAVALVVGLGLVAPAVGHAAPLDLPGALAAARSSNLDLARQAQQVAIARAERGEAVSTLIPTVAASGATVLDRTDPWTTYGELRADLPLVSVDGWLGARAAGLALDAAELDAEDAEEQILGAAGFRYVDLARAEQAVVEAEALLTRSERLLALAADRVAVGAAAPIENTRAELLARQDELRLIEARTERDTARLRLLEVLGLPLDGAIEVAIGPVAAPPTGAPDRPDLAAAARTVAAATAAKRAIAAQLVPDLSAFGTAGLLAIDGAGDPTPTASVGLQADVVLFSGTLRSHTVQRLDAVARDAAIAAEDLGREASVEIASADAAVATGARSWELAQSARGLAEQEVALAEDRFATGAASNVEVVEAQARLTQAVVAEVDALAAYNLALLDAWRSRGRLRELAG
ncbi:MAG: efflux RND transporter permease subunit, partial [Myxococcota bacterium]